MGTRIESAACVLFLSTLALGQVDPPPHPPKPAAAASLPAPSLSQDQIRELIRLSADKDIQNDKKLRDYTYVERDEETKLDGKGNVKSTELKTYDGWKSTASRCRS